MDQSLDDVKTPRKRTAQGGEELINIQLFDLNINFIMAVRSYANGAIESKIFEKSKLMNHQWTKVE